MAGFGDLVQKAFYLGVGVASYAAEKAGSTLTELRSQAQKLADELVARGEITTEEAKKMVDEMVIKAQQTPPSAPGEPPAEPRRIEILSEDEESAAATPEAQAVDNLREQIAKLQEELQRLKRES
jgi:polyhydroxyalkanoate synthesis regulator phasin